MHSTGSPPRGPAVRPCPSASWRMRTAAWISGRKGGRGGLAYLRIALTAVFHQESQPRLEAIDINAVDTVGESFELNVAAAQEAGTLVGTAKPIILAQGSVWKKWNYSYQCTPYEGREIPACST